MTKPFRNLHFDNLGEHSLHHPTPNQVVVRNPPPELDPAPSRGGDGVLESVGHGAGARRGGLGNRSQWELRFAGLVSWVADLGAP